MSKPYQYTIVNKLTEDQVQWIVKNDTTEKYERLTILFDTKEEAEELIASLPFFDGKDIEIRGGIYYIDDNINYKDLKVREDFQKELEEHNHG